MIGEVAAAPDDDDDDDEDDEDDEDDGEADAAGNTVAVEDVPDGTDDGDFDLHCDPFVYIDNTH